MHPGCGTCRPSVRRLLTAGERRAPWGVAPLRARMLAFFGVPRNRLRDLWAANEAARQSDPIGVPAWVPPTWHSGVGAAGGSQDRIAPSKACQPTRSAVTAGQLGSEASSPATPPAKGGAPDTPSRRAGAHRPTSEARNCGRLRGLPAIDSSIVPSTRRSPHRP